jgi:hypothetical protein
VEVGVVSERYALLQHAEVVDEFVAAARWAGIDPHRLAARLTLTELGTRMALRVFLPDEYALRPADGHSMGLTFECFNSVDGSVPLQALLGWFRFVCGNGLAVGTTTARIRRKHVPASDEPDFADVLTTGLEAAEQERNAFDCWSAASVTREALSTWVDGTVAQSWGPMAAARLFAIATTGFDGTPRPQRRRVLPHERRVTPTVRVPGTPEACRNHYDVAQALAWMASRRTSVSAQQEWRGAIGSLMTSLANLGRGQTTD